MGGRIPAQILEMVFDIEAQAEEDIVPDEELAAVVVGRVDGRDAAIHHAFRATYCHLNKVKLSLQNKKNEV